MRARNSALTLSGAALFTYNTKNGPTPLGTGCTGPQVAPKHVGSIRAIVRARLRGDFKIDGRGCSDP